MRSRRLPLIIGLCAGLALSGCVVPAAVQADAAGESFNDPYEDTNRAVFNFNQVVDENVLVPVATAYRDGVPPPVRQSVHDFLQNLGGPVIFANDVLQAQPALAADTLARLALNTTVGIGGLFDVATRIGVPYHPNDLGITLATWGFAEGPYIVIPVLGPSNPRDIVGQIGDSFADPGDYVAGQYHRMWASVARALTAGVDERSRNIESLADIQRTSLDYYATIRSLYRQRRAAQIRHEQSNLPNPSPVQGSDSASDAYMSYSIAKPPQPREVPTR